MNKARLEAFTDDVIAIAATIMVLELHTPKTDSLRGLLTDWPVLLSYIISFTLIYIVWYSHHNAFNKAKLITTKTFLYNGMWLFTLTLVPFATAWVGEHPDAAVPELFYLVILLIWALIFQLMDEQIIRDNPKVKRDASNNLRTRIILYGGYIVGMILAFVWPISALFLVALITVVLAVQLTMAPATPRQD
ncbi:TMEM175 family protein [Secundilactobacillus paracollinoides]|uniref:TMEM175 family protein n=1 Tax=Secundilactobacillus paracollinoides TaxID=240427 RepID=UPI0006D0C116|nr:TMEM175 family protein [Secundilactobacillus paracollinoides]KRL78844.1 integral membrane protein [Secundilactobacillus paracollinoides DSM 15502 = JCM 11969]